MSPELRSTRADIGDGGVNGCTWIDNGMGYAVVATLPDTTLDRVADQISREGG
jgi:anti-sigma factor RsiW